MENSIVGHAHVGSRGKGSSFPRSKLFGGWTPVEAKINGFIGFNLYD